jgi:uncharacterized membrane protein
VIVGAAGIGTSPPAKDVRAFRWTSATGMQDLGHSGVHSYATRVSWDGSVVVGGECPYPFYWTQGSGMVRMWEYGGASPRPSGSGAGFAGRCFALVPLRHGLQTHPTATGRNACPPEKG